MSCTVMYQPYAMSYSSSCDRTTADNLKKSFKFPHAPSPPESSHSNASSAYSSPGSTAGGGILGSLSLLPPHLHSPSASSLSSLSNNGASSISGQRRPLTPSLSCASGVGGGSSAPATITSATSQQQQQQGSHHHHSSSSSHSHGGSSSHHPHHSSSHHHHPHHSSSSTSASATTPHHHQLHHHHHHRNSSSVSASSSLYPLAHSSSLNLSNSSGAVQPQASATATSSRDLSQHGPSSASSSSSGSTSSHHQAGQSSNMPSATVTSGGGDQSDDESPGGRNTNSEAAGGGGGGGVEETQGASTRAQYLSANCILYVNYDGNTARVVEEHFNRALSAGYTGEKSSKSLPMSTRNFPASFWNSNYQPAKASAAAALGPYGAADFYGTAMDYSASISGFAHHHPQADPWHHYPLSTHHHHHQSYHRPSDITYPSMTSTSRFNAAAQYGSFLFPSTSAAAARFSGIPTPGQCSVKGVTADAAHHWAAAATAGGRYDGWSDLHLAADYSAAAAAHYSNMTAAAGKGLDFETHYLQSS